MKESVAIPDCGVCDTPHCFHCPRAKSWCNNCLPLAVQVSEPEDEYLPVLGLTPKGILAAERYQRRRNLREVS